MVDSHPKLQVEFHIPTGLLGPDPEALGTERFDRIMAALDEAAYKRPIVLPQTGAQEERRTALAA